MVQPWFNRIDAILCADWVRFSRVKNIPGNFLKNIPGNFRIKPALGSINHV